MATMEEDARRRQVIEQAVEAADRIILDGSGGSNEETDFLTGQVALRFVEKINARLADGLSSFDMRYARR